MKIGAKKKEKLFEKAKNDEMSCDDVDLVGELMASGYTISKALKKRKEFHTRIMRITINSKEEEKLLKQHPEFQSITKLYLAIFNGKIPTKDGLALNLH
jgi:hypothetical protein